MGSGRSDRAVIAELRVWLIVTRQARERDAALAALRRDLLDAIWPVAHAAQQAHHHQLGVGDDVLDIGIDRQVMRELQQVGEAQARLRLGEMRMGARQARQLAVRRRQHHDLARRLAKVDGLAAIGDLTGPGSEQMHG